MKCFLLLAGLFVSAYGLPPEIIEQIKQTVMGFAGECKGETGATDDDVSVLKSNQVPTTSTGKCFIACMHKKFGMQDPATGKIDRDTTQSMLAKMKPLDSVLYGKMKKVADVCLAEVTDGAEECETGYNLAVCFHRENENVGIEPLDF